MPVKTTVHTEDEAGAEEGGAAEGGPGAPRPTRTAGGITTLLGGRGGGGAGGEAAPPGATETITAGVFVVKFAEIHFHKSLIYKKVF